MSAENQAAKNLLLQRSLQAACKNRDCRASSALYEHFPGVRVNINLWPAGRRWLIGRYTPYCPVGPLVQCHLVVLANPAWETQADMPWWCRSIAQTHAAS